MQHPLFSHVLATELSVSHYPSWRRTEHHAVWKRLVPLDRVDKRHLVQSHWRQPLGFQAIDNNGQSLNHREWARNSQSHIVKLRTIMQIDNRAAAETLVLQHTADDALHVGLSVVSRIDIGIDYAARRHLAEERLAQGTVVERVGAPEDEPLARDVRNRYLGLVIITDVVVMLVAMVADDVAGPDDALERLRKRSNPFTDDEERGANTRVGKYLQNLVCSRGIWPIVEGQGDLWLVAPPVHI